MGSGQSDAFYYSFWDLQLMFIPGGGGGGGKDRGYSLIWAI